MKVWTLKSQSGAAWRHFWLFLLVPITLIGFTGTSAAAPSGSTDLKVTKTASSSTASIGSKITYTVKVENLGPETATGVTLTDQLPKETDYVSAAATSGACARKGQKVSCTIASIPVGTTVTATIVVIVRKPGTISNTASVNSDQKDPVTANDKSTANTSVPTPAKRPTCAGVKATIIGSAGNDQIVGTRGRDVVAAYGGRDLIKTFGGRDLICAGKGNDRVISGRGNDLVLGGPGADRLIGRGGADLLKGNGGNDVLKGNLGNDLLKGNRGNDVLKGNRGDDRLLGGFGFDRCFGGFGFDTRRSCEA